MNFDFIATFTENFDAMRDFYRDVIELSISHEQDKYVEYQVDAFRFAICERSVMQNCLSHPAFDKPASGQKLELAFPFESRKALEEKYRDLVERGAQEIQGPKEMPWGHYTAFFADPDGNVHELYFRG